MKGINGALLFLLLSMVQPAFSGDIQPESAHDYAFGVKLNTPETSPWYQVSLPLTVYQQTTSSALWDVRVFNRDDEAVPFSLIQKTQPKAMDAQPVALRLFPLAFSPIDKEHESSGEKVLLRSKEGLEIRFRLDKSESIGSGYLLALPEGQQEAVDIAQLKLVWDKPQVNWQGSVSVWKMDNPNDNQRWYQVKENVPLMDLTSGSDRLKLDTIDLQTTLSEKKKRFLLLTFTKDSPRLLAASAIPLLAEKPSQSIQVALTARGERISDHQAVWHWDNPQPLSSLQIRLSEEGTLPVALEWRSAAKAPWQPLMKTVIYQLDGKKSAPVNLPGRQVEAVRITSLNSRLPATLPRVTGERDGYQLVFNAQGKGPYILAWGNGAAQQLAVSMDELIPEALRKSHAVDSLPLAGLEDSVKLGGEARLSAASTQMQSSQWKTLLVWAILITGVLVLTGMAWKLWREVQNGRS